MMRKTEEDSKIVISLLNLATDFLCNTGKTNTLMSRGLISDPFKRLEFQKAGEWKFIAVSHQNLRV